MSINVGAEESLIQVKQETKKKNTPAAASAAAEQLLKTFCEPLFEPFSL